MIGIDDFDSRSLIDIRTFCLNCDHKVQGNLYETCSLCTLVGCMICSRILYFQGILLEEYVMINWYRNYYKWHAGLRYETFQISSKFIRGEEKLIVKLSQSMIP